VSEYERAAGLIHHVADVLEERSHRCGVVFVGARRQGVYKRVRDNKTNTLTLQVFDQPLGLFGLVKSEWSCEDRDWQVGW